MICPLFALGISCSFLADRVRPILLIEEEVRDRRGCSGPIDAGRQARGSRNQPLLCFILLICVEQGLGVKQRNLSAIDLRVKVSFRKKLVELGRR
jgi:hypothetical protein